MSKKKKRKRQETVVRWIGFAMIVVSSLALTFFYDFGAWLLAGLAMTGGAFVAVADS